MTLWCASSENKWSVPLKTQLLFSNFKVFTPFGFERSFYSLCSLTWVEVSVQPFVCPVWVVMTTNWIDNSCFIIYKFNLDCFSVHFVNKCRMMLLKLICTLLKYYIYQTLLMDNVSKALLAVIFIKYILSLANMTVLKEIYYLLKKKLGILCHTPFMELETDRTVHQKDH